MVGFAVCLSVEQMSSPPEESTPSPQVGFVFLSLPLSRAHTFFPLFSAAFLIFSFIAHAIILKINLAQIRKNWASWVTQMTSLFLLEDKVFIRGLVGLLQEVSEFE